MVVTILAGLLMAIAFQFLLTNLGIALGITVVSFRPKPITAHTAEALSSEDESSEDESDAKPDESGPSSRVILQAVGIATGLSILLTISGVLAIACFLAVRLSLTPDPVVGGILGILIWAAYVLLLTWVSSVAVGSVVDTALSSVTTGFRQLLSAVRTLLNRESTTPLPSSPLSQDVTETVRQQVDAALAAMDLRQPLDDYLATLATSSPVSSSPVSSSPVSSLSEGANPDFPSDVALTRPNPPRSTPKALANGQSTRRFTSAPPNRQPLTTEATAMAGFEPSSLLSSLGGQLRSLLPQVDVSQAAQWALQQALDQVDLSEWDLERVWHQIQASSSDDNSSDPDASNASNALPAFNLIRLDAETYLRHAQPWELQPDILQTEFAEVLYDPDAAPHHILPWLAALDRSFYVQQLQQRQDLEPKQIDQIADQLMAIQTTVQHQVEAAATAAQTPAVDVAPDSTTVTAVPAVLDGAIALLHDKLESYLRYTNLDKLTADGIEQKLHSLLEDCEIPADAAPPSALDCPRLEQVLSRRQGLGEAHKKALLAQLTQTWNRVARPPESRQALSAEPESLQSLQVILSRTVTDVLQDIDWSGITLEDAKQELLAAIAHPQGGVQSLSRHLSTVDWSPVIQRLQSHQLSDDQVSQIMHQLQQRLYRATGLPRRWLRRHRPDLSTRLHRYLQHQAKDKLTPSAIQQDLRHLIAALPSASLPFQATKAPKSADDSESRNHADSDDMHQNQGKPDPTAPDEGEQDAEKHDATHQISRVAESFPVHPSDIVQWLESRRDLTQAEVMSAAQHVQTAWQSLSTQAQDLGHQASSTLGSLQDAAQPQLDRLQATDIDIDRVQKDIGDRLQAPFASLDSLQDALSSLLQSASQSAVDAVSFDEVRDRLQRTSQEALDRVAHFRDDLSDTISTGLVHQIESTRDQLLNRLEQVQEQVQTQVDQTRRHVQTQADNARRVAAIAAWWLFFTTLTSGVLAATAGVYAVIGLPGF